MSDEMPREVLNIEEAAALLGVSVKTFNKVLHSENIPGRKIGREWKFSRQALVDWIGKGRSEQFYEITPLPNGRGARETAQEAEGHGGGGDDRPGGGGSGTRRTSGWRLKLD